MKVRLLEPHVIDGVLVSAGEEMDLKEPSHVTLEMVPLDQAALTAMQAEYERAYDKYKGIYYKWWVAQYGVRGRFPDAVHVDPVVVDNVAPRPLPPRPPRIPQHVVPPPQTPIGKVKLLESHVINDRFHEKNDIVNIHHIMEATPLMEGLDSVTQDAIQQAKYRVWARHPGVPYNIPSGKPPLDAVPIPRPLDENQPVEHAHLRNFKDYIS